jgi:hypothetical protein
MSSQKIRQRLEKLGAVYKESLRLDGKVVIGFCRLRKLSVVEDIEV